MQTGNRGWGLKTLVDINKGDFIVEYCGEVRTLSSVSGAELG